MGHLHMKMMADPGFWWSHSQLLYRAPQRQWQVLASPPWGALARGQPEPKQCGRGRGPRTSNNEEHLRTGHRANAKSPAQQGYMCSHLPSNQKEQQNWQCHLWYLMCAVSVQVSAKRISCLQDKHALSEMNQTRKASNLGVFYIWKYLHICGVFHDWEPRSNMKFMYVSYKLCLKVTLHNRFLIYVYLHFACDTSHTVPLGVEFSTEALCQYSKFQILEHFRFQDSRLRIFNLQWVF